MDLTSGRALQDTTWRESGQLSPTDSTSTSSEHLDNASAIDVLVVGAGTMGSGIAQVAASAGLMTTLADTSRDQLERAVETIRSRLDRSVSRGTMDSKARDNALGCLSISADMEADASRAKFAIEAVVEDLAIKQSIFRILAEAAPPSSVLATNTSALSISELASSCGEEERVVGMHFFNPVPTMRLVEVVRGLNTNRATIKTTVRLARRMGKEPVVVNEAPGFAVSRINAMIGNEAFYMLMEGVASAESIDKALKLGLNHPMGPFELGDLVGWDIRLDVLNYLHSSLGEKFRPCPLLVQYVRAGRLGRKVGRGVYDYTVAAATGERPDLPKAGSAD
jgi:3-hydroxybutyryl-CoA dehydrogenase